MLTGNEKKEGTHSRPIARVRITTGNRLLRRNDDVAENTAETMNKNSTCFHPNVEYRNRFISEIISVIGHHVVAFVNKIIALNRKLLYSLSAILRKCLNIDVLRINASVRYICGLNDYDQLANILYHPLDSNQGSPSKHGSRDAEAMRVSKAESCIRIHKIRHSIIEDKINDIKYLFTDTSRHNCRLISKRNWGQLYRTRRSLLIRSRLKTYLNSQDREREHPFSLLKHARKKLIGSHLLERNNNESTDTDAKRETYKLNSSEKFWAPPEIIKASEKNSEISRMRYRYDDEFKEQIAHEYSRDDIANNAMREYAIIGNIAASNELVINVHDYLELRTEINTSVHESRRYNRSACLLTSNN